MSIIIAIIDVRVIAGVAQGKLPVSPDTAQLPGSILKKAQDIIGQPVAALGKAISSCQEKNGDE